MKQSQFTPQPVPQELLLPDAFPSLPAAIRERFGAEAEAFDANSKRWWQRTKRVLSDSHYELARPQNEIKQDTKNIRKEFVAADAVLSASFTEAIEIVVDDMGALAMRTTTLESKVDTPVTGLLARVTLVESTYATQTYAEAKKTEAITAAAGYTNSQVSAEALARATVDGYFSGKYSLHVDVAGPTISSGALVVGRAYQITGAGDFTNVGATSNAIGTRFIASGTTPTAWGAVRQLIGTGFNVSSITDGGANTNEIVFQTDRFSLQTASGTPIQLLDVTADGFVFGTDLASDNFTPGSDGWRLTRAGRLEVQEGNIAGFEIGPNALFATNGTAWVALNTNFGLTPYIELGSASGRVRHDAISIGGKKITGGYDLWALDEGFGGGVLRLWDGSGTAKFFAKGSDGSLACGAISAGGDISAGSHNLIARTLAGYIGDHLYLGAGGTAHWSISDSSGDLIARGAQRIKPLSGSQTVQLVAGSTAISFSESGGVGYIHFNGGAGIPIT